MIFYIEDKTSAGVLTVKLDQILTMLQECGYDRSRWRIVDIEGRASSAIPFNLLEFEDRVARVADGLSVEWEQLQELGRYLFDLIDLALISSTGCSRVRVSLIDSSFWEIECHDTRLFDVASRRFRSVKRLD